VLDNGEEQKKCGLGKLKRVKEDGGGENLKN